MHCDCGATMCYLCRKPVPDNYTHFYGNKLDTDNYTYFYGNKLDTDNYTYFYGNKQDTDNYTCLLYTSPSPRDS